MHSVHRLLARLVFVVVALGHGAIALAQSATSITSPTNRLLTGPDQTFQWQATGASLYQLWIGSTPGAYDVGYFPALGTTGTSVDVTGLPTDGRTLYLTMWSLIGGAYYSTASSVEAAVSGAALSTNMFTNPTNGSTLSGSTQAFGWKNAVGATLYQLWVGSSPGAFDIGQFPAGGTTNTSLTATGLPTDGRTLYVTLWSLIGGVYQSSPATYTASGGSAPPALAVLTSPTDGSTLAGSSQVFQWVGGAGATYYQLWIGSTPGGYDIGYFPAGGTTSSPVFVSGLPTDGRTLYATLWSLVGGVYQSSAATYTASGGSASPMPAALTSPADGSTLPGTSVMFQWNAAPGATMYQLWIGSTPGAFDVGYFPSAGTTGTSVTASGLPTDGRTLYATLWSAIGGTYYSTASTYTASAASVPVPAAITSPTIGSTLSGADVTFQWNAAPGAMLYQLWIGSTPGAYDLGYFPAAGTTSTSTAAIGLPTDGRTLYVRLWTAFGSGYQFNDSMFTAASFAPPPSGAGAVTWPAEGSSLAGVTDTFRWNAVPGAYGYQLWVGSAPGDFDVGVYPSGLTSDTMIDATGLPIDGRQLYVRLWAATMDGYSFTDSTFYADKGTFPGEPGLPMPGLSWTLPGPAVAFDTASVFDKTLTIGNSVGSSEFGSGIKGGLQTWFSNLPIDGRTLYARLTWTSSLQPGQTRFRDYPMTAAPTSPAAVMLSPAQNQGLEGVGTVFSFTFSDVGASAYKIWAGTSLGGQEYGEFPGPGGTTSTTIAVTVPAGQIPSRIRLWSLVGGVWYYRDYQYWQIIG